MMKRCETKAKKTQNDIRFNFIVYVCNFEHGMVQFIAKRKWRGTIHMRLSQMLLYDIKYYSHMYAKY
jgi:hypothetical protein